MTKINHRDRRLLKDAIASVHRIGVTRAANVSGLSEQSLRNYVNGAEPTYLRRATRDGLRLILLRDTSPPGREETEGEPVLIQLLRRAVDALEEIATAAIIVAESIEDEDLDDV